MATTNFKNYMYKNLSNQNTFVKKGADYVWLKKIAQDEDTKKMITFIEQSEKDIKLNNYRDDVIKLRLGKYIINSRISDAWFQMKMFTEIMKYNDHSLIEDFIGKDAKLVINLGANIGFYSLKLREKNSQCRIISVEPNPFTYSILTKNIKDNKIKNITLLNNAIAGESGLLNFNIIDEATALCGKYLGKIKKEERSWIKDSMIKTISVKAITLSDLFKKQKIKNVDLLQMDIEEMELEVLESSTNILSSINKIIIEWHDPVSKNKLINFLTSHQFDLIYEEPRMFGDLYFKNKNYTFNK